MTGNLSKLITLLFGVLWVIGCNSYKKSIRKERMSEITPPGCIMLDSNLYFDSQPISNLSWLEYRYWLKRVYGANSIEFKHSLQDTTVWLNSGYNRVNQSIYYHNHPMYNSWPVVGVSKTQAEQYARWRTDRVTELILIQAGYRDIGIEDTFTIERLKTNKVKLNMPLTTGFLIPQYSVGSATQYKFVIDSMVHEVNDYPTLQMVNSKKKNKWVTVAQKEEMDNVHDYLSKNLVEMTSDSNHIRGDWCEELYEQGDVPFVDVRVNPIITFRNTCSWERLFENVAQN